MDTMQVHLPNGSDGDSLVLVRLENVGRCVVFDSGDVRRLPQRDVLRLSHVFVSHCHVDHFIGFDALLRPRVCREDEVTVLGPPGFLARVASRLSGYTWNLVEGNHFAVTAMEIREDGVHRARFDSGDEFRRDDLPVEPRREIVLSDPCFTVRTAALDHRIVSQGWALHGPPRLSIRVDALDAAGLADGSWLGRLKEAIAAGADRALPFALPSGESKPLGEVADRLVTQRPGERIAYVTDTLFSPTTRERIVKLADQADVFACEAPFLAAEGDRAEKTHHLTAQQAGLLAAEAGVRKLLLFHVSERYRGDFSQHAEEASAACGGRVEVEVQPRWPVLDE